MYEKLLLVQQEIGAIKKDSVNPHFKNTYFDINSLLAEVKPILNKHGLVLTQALTNIEGKPALETRISLANIQDSKGGNWAIEGSVPLPEGLDAMRMGGAITYFRRYALVSLLALEAEDNDTAGEVPTITEETFQAPGKSIHPRR